MCEYNEAQKLIFSLNLTPSEQCELMREVERTAFPSWRACRDFIIKKYLSMIESEDPESEFYEYRRRVL